ncbi:MAG: hypothetical protein MJZ21_04520, partial [archaeon]|nr:hypothetical protein [archaeon]
VDTSGTLTDKYLGFSDLGQIIVGDLLSSASLLLKDFQGFYAKYPIKNIFCIAWKKEHVG